MTEPDGWLVVDFIRPAPLASATRTYRLQNAWGELPSMTHANSHSIYAWHGGEALHRRLTTHGSGAADG